MAREGLPFLEDVGVFQYNEMVKETSSQQNGWGVAVRCLGLFRFLANHCLATLHHLLMIVRGRAEMMKD